jgi:hypothetical protein
MGNTSEYDLIIIGAGIGGIISLKYARDAGLNAIVLEKANEVGGLWRDLPAWQDLPISRNDWGLGPLTLAAEDQPHVLANIRAWVERFKLADGIRLNCAATSACHDGSTWIVQTTQGTLHAKYLIAATGAHNIPRIPETFRQQSAVTEYHSSQLQNPAELARKDVVVVGGGASAMDMLDLCFQAGARNVHWVYRSVKWIIPTRKTKYETAGLRMMAKRQLLGTTSAQMSAALAPMFKHLYKRYGLQDIMPETPFDMNREQALPGRRGMIENFARITRHKGCVNKIENRTVHLSDAAQVEADVLLWGTGYAMDLSYFKLDRLAQVDSPTSLLRQCGSRFLSLDYPNLFFLGTLLDGNGSTPWFYAHISKSIMTHIKGRPVFDRTPTDGLLNHFELLPFLAARNRRNFLPGVWQIKSLTQVYLRKEGKTLPLP